MNLSKDFYNSSSWGENSLAVLLRGAEKSHGKVNCMGNTGLGKWSREHRGVETIGTNAFLIGDDRFLLDLCTIKIISVP